METQSFLFGCCSSFVGLNDQESEIHSLIRSKITKGKKTNLASIAHSPKSSLKTFKSMKNLNDIENLNVYNSTLSLNQGEKCSKLSSAREIPVTYYLKKIDKFLSPCSNQVKRSVYSDYKELNIPSSIPSPKSNIKFSYNNENNPEKKSEAPPSPLLSQNEKIVLNKYQISNRKSNFTTPSECELNNNEKQEIKKKLVQSKKSLEWTKSERESIIGLGESRFTIKSSVEMEIQVEEDGLEDMKIDESCIIVDVFHASDSQVKKWDNNKNNNNK